MQLRRGDFTISIAAKWISYSRTWFFPVRLAGHWLASCGEENPFVKILLVTGYTEQMGLNGAKTEEFLAKPFSTETLLQRVRQLLDAAGPRSEKRNR